MGLCVERPNRRGEALRAKAVLFLTFLPVSLSLCPLAVLCPLALLLPLSSLSPPPTRELALQIQKVIGALGDFMNIKIHACVGGTAVRDDIRTLQDGVHVVVGTPGRVYDMIQRRALRLDSVQLFVLDEADEMLSRGFKEQIYDVFK